MHRGRAQFVSLVGEAGTGKTRLIAEFTSRLAGRRAARTHRAVRHAACSSLGQPTYGIFRCPPSGSLRHWSRGFCLRPCTTSVAWSAEAWRQVAVAEEIAPFESRWCWAKSVPRSPAEGSGRSHPTHTAGASPANNCPCCLSSRILHWGPMRHPPRDLASDLADRRLMILVSHPPSTQAAPHARRPVNHPTYPQRAG